MPILTFFFDTRYLILDTLTAPFPQSSPTLLGSRSRGHGLIGEYAGRGESQVLEVCTISFFVKSLARTRATRYIPGFRQLIDPQSCSAHANTTFDQEWTQRLARQIADFLQANVVWIGLQQSKTVEGSGLIPDEVITMLDYACGDGLASRVSD